MSRRKEKTNRKLEILNEINRIDKKIKRLKHELGSEKLTSLFSKRETLKSKLKTKK